MSEMKLKNKVAIVTGGAGEIGKGIVKMLSSEGAAVIVADIDGLSGDELVKDITEQGGEAIYVNVNLAKINDCQRVVDIAKRNYGQLDILVNNVGITHCKDSGILEIEEKIWDMTFSINVKSACFMCKYAIPLLLKSTKAPSIINIASIVAVLGSAIPNIAYTSSKGALLAFTRELAVMYASKNIRVNALCPGPVATNKIDSQLKKIDKEVYLNRIPMHRFASIEEIAKAVLFLASEDSSYITGSTFLIDGGITAAALVNEK